MNHSAHHLFMLDGTFVLVVLLLLTVVVAVGSNVLHRSVALEREIATRRVLGARRSDIARTFLLESMGPLLLGSCRFAALALPLFSNVQPLGGALLIGEVGVACCGTVGAHLAARHASHVAFGRSGLFGGASDKRGG
jgi:ABC-type lipoprotein release transport system permease subunit